jgi:hypothetical protein
MLFAPLAGIGADRAGNRPFMAGGLLLMGGGFLWLALTLQAGVGYASLIGPSRAAVLASAAEPVTGPVTGRGRR